MPRTPSRLLPFIALPFALWLLSAAPAPALNAGQELNETLEALRDSRERESELAAQVARVRAELDRLQHDSDRLVRDIRRLQRDVADNRRESAQLTIRLAARQRDLDKRREEIGKLLHGMVRLQRMPRHFVLARPGNSQDLLRTASALHISYEASHAEAAAVQREFAALKALSQRLKQNQATLTRDLANLQTKRDALKQTVTERRRLQQTLRSDHETVRRRVAELSQQSHSLRELIARLESETALFRELGAPPGKPEIPSREAVRFAARKGRLPYPASGRFLHRYGDKQAPGEQYRGQVIETAPRALVTAPHEGKVVFSGSFMDYGPMVILQHDETYHSVIAGLDVIEVEPGQPVRADELIGVMGNSAQTRKLYFELRKHSKPIDPAAWMGKLTAIASR